VTAVFATQTLVNLGMVTGLLPVVGIPLPLMCYGGSTMVVSLMGLGLLLSIRMRQFY
jgi:rod shape determining protein RodA